LKPEPSFIDNYSLLSTDEAQIYKKDSKKIIMTYLLDPGIEQA